MLSSPENVDGVVVGAGDIAGCVKTGDEVTVDLSDLIPGAILTTSEDTHKLGSREEPNSCYGRNRSYSNGEAGDSDAGYYSYDLGAWHVISLDSAACEEARECEKGSPLLEWLEEDLAANERPCTLAYWRHPLFSSGPGSNHPFMWAVWDALYAARADVVVNGHDHTYERFAPQTPEGNADPERGIREFVARTEDKQLHSFKEPKPNSELRNSGSHGVLKLTLRPGSYEWEFVPATEGTFKDSGSSVCH